MDQIHALYLWIDEVVAGLAEIATIGSFSFWMAILAASKFENCGNCLTCSAAVHETTGRGVGRRRRGRSAESEPLSTWTNNRSSKLEFTHTTGCLKQSLLTTCHVTTKVTRGKLWYGWASSLVLVHGVSFQAKFIRATRLARIEKVVRKLLFAGGRNRLLPCDGIQSSHCRRWSIVEKLGFLPGQTFTTNATFKHLHQHLLAQKKSRAALMTLIHIFTTIYRAQTRIQCKERWICRASSKNLDVSNAVMIIDEYPLSSLNHCSLLGHQWMLPVYVLINNGAWNSFYDGSCLIYLLLLIEHISKSCEFTGDASPTNASILASFWHYTACLVLIIQSNVEPLQIILFWLHTRVLSVCTLIETIWHAPANFDEPIMTDPGPHCVFVFYWFASLAILWLLWKDIKNVQWILSIRTTCDR